MRSRGNGSLRRRKSIWEFIGQRPRLGAAREATSLPTAASPLVAWWELVGSLGPTWLGPKAPWSSFVREKIISGILFRLDSIPKSDLKRVKNTEKQELARGTELIG